MSRSQLLAAHRASAARSPERIPRCSPLSEDGSVSCIDCGSQLSFLPYAYPFTFGCERGHFLTLQTLLDVFLPQEHLPNLSTLECWDRKSQLMRHLARRALEVGHVLTAADFQEVAVRIDHWVTTLRNMTPHNESEALLSA